MLTIWNTVKVKFFFFVEWVKRNVRLQPKQEAVLKRYNSVLQRWEKVELEDLPTHDQNRVLKRKLYNVRN